MSQLITYKIPSIQALEEVAPLLLHDWSGKRIFAFEGPMGAGKTTIIKALCKHLQCTDNVCSPTFAIINVYQTCEQGPVYHFDLYRLKDAHELLATGALEYFDSGAWCFIEWPEIAIPLLPEDAVWARLSVLNDGTRLLVTQNYKEAVETLSKNSKFGL